MDVPYSSLTLFYGNDTAHHILHLTFELLTKISDHFGENVNLERPMNDRSTMCLALCVYVLLARGNM